MCLTSDKCGVILLRMICVVVLCSLVLATLVIIVKNSYILIVKASRLLAAACNNVQAGSKRVNERLNNRQVCEYEQVAGFSFCLIQQGNERRKGRMYKDEMIQRDSRVVLGLSGALVFEVGLFDAPAEGQQVAVALDPLC